MPPLLAEIRRLDERHPGSTWKEVGGRTETCPVLFLIERRNTESDVLPFLQRTLRFDVEGANRLDLVAEELDTQRVGGVGREEVEDAAAKAEFARDLDDLRPHQA